SINSADRTGNRVAHFYRDQSPLKWLNIKLSNTCDPSTLENEHSIGLDTLQEAL
ncbi:MAG: hypothetical protein K0Q73_4616, partial [Paenibacillus sp.]|nr:hypothetical protein [Paenibacillus sp.]